MKEIEDGRRSISSVVAEDITEVGKDIVKTKKE